MSSRVPWDGPCPAIPGQIYHDNFVKPELRRCPLCNAEKVVRAPIIEIDDTPPRYTASVAIPQVPARRFATYDRTAEDARQNAIRKSKIDPPRTQLSSTKSFTSTENPNSRVKIEVSHCIAFMEDEEDGFQKCLLPIETRQKFLFHLSKFFKTDSTLAYDTFIQKILEEMPVRSNLVPTPDQSFHLATKVEKSAGPTYLPMSARTITSFLELLEYFKQERGAYEVFFVQQKVITNLENMEEPEQTARTDQGYSRKGKQEENQKESKKVKKEKVKREPKRIKKEESQTPVT
ncbi:MAG: hypothetical protein Q9167_008006, partial [Letrouitia subvulpina]